MESIFLGVLYTQTHTSKTKKWEYEIYSFLLNRTLVSFHVHNFQIHDLQGGVSQTVLSLACLYLPPSVMDLISPRGQGGRVLCIRPPEHFPVSQSTCRHQLVFQELGGVGDRKSMLLFPGMWGVSLELFLFLIKCVVKQGCLIPALHSTESHLTPHSPQLRYQLQELPQCPWDPGMRGSSGSIFQKQMQSVPLLIFSVLTGLYRRVGSNGCFVFLIFFKKAHIVNEPYTRV